MQKFPHGIADHPWEALVGRRRANVREVCVAPSKREGRFRMGDAELRCARMRVRVVWPALVQWELETSRQEGSECSPWPVGGDLTAMLGCQVCLPIWGRGCGWTGVPEGFWNQVWMA